MFDREAIVPLTLGLLVAVAAHLAAATFVVLEGSGRAPEAKPREREHKLRAGDPTPAPAVASWISHEDYQKLLARRAALDQAAAQRRVKPVAHASTPSNPTPPAPTPKRPARERAMTAPTASPAAADAAPADPPPAPAEPSAFPAPRAASPPPSSDAPSVASIASMNDSPQAAGASPESPAVSPPSPSPREQEQRPSNEASRAAVPKRNQKSKTEDRKSTTSRPTRAPKENRESSPASRLRRAEVVPGEVIARRGLRINTAHADISSVARGVAMPANPVAKVIFDSGGKVLRARLLRSSGYANVDGPILASLYKWTVSGESLGRIDETFTMRVRIVLVEDAHGSH